MRIFVDSANLDDIEAALQRGFVSGITTNPSIVSRETPRVSADELIEEIIDLIRRTGPHYVPPKLSVEVTSLAPDAMLAQALWLLNRFGSYPALFIKVPIGWDELRVIDGVVRAGGKVNCTCCMSYNQAIMAANAGASYVSLFWGRIRDTGYDASSVVREVHRTLVEHHSPSEIIVGSIRQMIDVNEALQAGADIVTVPPPILPLLCQHPKTDEAVAQFARDYNSWRKPVTPA